MCQGGEGGDEAVVWYALVRLAWMHPTSAPHVSQRATIMG